MLAPLVRLTPVMAKRRRIRVGRGDGGLEGERARARTTGISGRTAVIERQRGRARHRHGLDPLKASDSVMVSRGMLDARSRRGRGLRHRRRDRDRSGDR